MMRIIKSSEDKKLVLARTVLEEGTPEDVVARAEEYLRLLGEHLDRLRALKGVPSVSFGAQSNFARTLIEQIRGSIRTEIEESVREKNRMEELLDSLTMVTGWAAVQTFNERSYRNLCDWELIGTSVRSISAGARMAIPEAVAEASRIRREAFYMVRKAA